MVRKRGSYPKFGKKNSVGTMEGLCLSKSLKEAQEQLNPDTVKAMKKSLDELTTDGGPSLNNGTLKQFKKLCRKSDDYVRFAFLLIMQQLQKKHSEIRLSAFQVANELFHRSHAFRESLITHLQEFLTLTTETESGILLPPPKAAATRLKTDALKTIQEWYEKFGKAYRKLAVGYDYLKNCKHIDFDNIQAQNLAERKRIEEEEKRKQKMMAERLAKVLKDIAENKEEIDDCLREADSCLRLILPTPFDFGLPDDISDGNVKTNGEKAMPAALKKSMNGLDQKEDKNEIDCSIHGEQTSTISSLSSSPHLNSTTDSLTGQNSEVETAPEKINPDIHKSNHVHSENSNVLWPQDRRSCDTQKTTSFSNSKDEQERTSLKSSEEQNAVPKTATHFESSSCKMPHISSYDESDPTLCEKTKNADKYKDGSTSCEVVGNSNDQSESHPLESTNNESNDKDISTRCDKNDTVNDIKSSHESNGASSDDEEFEEDENSDLQLHGFRRPGFSLTIEVPAENVAIKETDDNTDVMQSLKDVSKLIGASYLPKVTKWLEILGKNGAKEEDIKTMIDLKMELESVNKKCLDLKLVVKEKPKDDDNSDEEDLEDVPEKEGYEAEVPEDFDKKCGFFPARSSSFTGAKSAPSCSLLKRKSDPGHEAVSSSTDHPSENKRASTNLYWNLKEREKTGSTSDPTSRAAALARIFQENPSLPSTSKSSQESGSSCSPSSSQEKKSSQAPFLAFGKDLAHWENPEDMEAPMIIKYDSLHRFWTPAENETEKASEHDKAALQYRIFNFSGNFEPVKWKCRAPMPNGTLCERMDRIKCPFHGKIIARNKDGKPSDPDPESSKEKVNENTSEPDETIKEELQPWKDPELQREIEAATGHDLGSARSQKLLEKSRKGKGKGKGKGKKSSGLTDIKAVSNTARKRLEKRIFNKGSLKKVCARLDAADFKRVRDKFGNQFNYSLN